MFLAGSLWVVVGGEVACLEGASGTGRPAVLNDQPNRSLLAIKRLLDTKLKIPYG